MSGDTFRRLTLLIAFVLVCLGGPILPPQTLATSPSIVISEFRTRGPNGGNDEFIELYNLSNSTVNIGGWLIKGSNSSGTVTTRAIINSGTILSPHCHYLLTDSNPTGGPYSGSVAGDQTYGVGITDDGGLALSMPDGTIVDQVGMSSGSVFKEGSTLGPLSLDSNRGYERRPGGTSGSGQDTDNNQSDFRLISPSDPQSAGSTCITGGASTDPSGSGAATPSPVNAGATTLLTVNVSPGSNPTSTGITVTGNLTPIGGSAVQTFFDDGINGDTVAGDYVFSFSSSVAAGTTAGAKSLTVTITDAQARSGTTSIALVVESTTAQCGVERWSVKTGTDPDASLVDLNQSTPTTITTMRSWTRPDTLPSNSRVAPYETTAWIVNATLTEYKREDDSDYHLVLRDDAGNTIIAEIPCPCCVSASSQFSSLVALARSKFDALFTPTDTFQTANVPVRVRGVGMFDFPHGQTGAAPNQIELHPVLDIAFNVDSHAPFIVGALIDGKKLIVFGLGFDDGAKLFLNGDKQKTRNNDDSPATTLIAKKAGKLIARGDTVTLQVRNSDGTLSEEFPFMRPN